MNYFEFEVLKMFFIIAIAIGVGGLVWKLFELPPKKGDEDNEKRRKGQ